MMSDPEGKNAIKFTPPQAKTPLFSFPKLKNLLSLFHSTLPWFYLHPHHESIWTPRSSTLSNVSNICHVRFARCLSASLKWIYCFCRINSAGDRQSLFSLRAGTVWVRPLWGFPQPAVPLSPKCQLRHWGAPMEELLFTKVVSSGTKKSK